MRPIVDSTEEVYQNGSDGTSLTGAFLFLYGMAAGRSLFKCAFIILDRPFCWSVLWVKFNAVLESEGDFASLLEIRLEIVERIELIVLYMYCVDVLCELCS